MSKRSTINTTDAEARPEQVDAEKVDTETVVSDTDTDTDAEKVDPEAVETDEVDKGDPEAVEAATGESEAAEGDTDADTDTDVEPDELDDPKKLIAALRRARSEAKNLRTRAKTAERVAAQYTAAAEVGLALSWATRLQGETVDELKTDAEEFVKAVGSVSPPRLQSLPDDGVTRGGSNEPAEERDLTVIGSRMYSN